MIVVFPEPVEGNITPMVVSMLRQAQQSKAQPPLKLAHIVFDGWSKSAFCFGFCLISGGACRSAVP